MICEQRFNHLYPVTAFFESILKDIRMSRSKIRDTDNLRTLYLTRFFVEYFLLLRTKALAVADIEKAEREKRRAEKGKQREMDPFAMLIHPLGETPDGDADVVDDTAEDAETYPFGLIGVMAQEDTIRWMQRRLTTAIDGKVGNGGRGYTPASKVTDGMVTNRQISWVELQACMSSIGHLASIRTGKADQRQTLTHHTNSCPSLKVWPAIVTTTSRKRLQSSRTRSFTTRRRLNLLSPSSNYVMIVLLRELIPQV